MNTVLMSLWRNDVGRNILGRCDHLLQKKATRWLWAVGDSSDKTEDVLRAHAEVDDRITVVRADLGTEGDTVLDSRMRTAFTASEMFRHLTDQDDIAILHESDLVSPVDLVERLTANPLPCAAWPIINLSTGPQFYDTYAFRGIRGQNFDASRKPVIQGLERVTSFGSCWAAPAHLVRNRILNHEAIVNLCAQWTKEDIPLYVDGRIVVEQPTSLWTAR